MLAAGRSTAAIFAVPAGRMAASAGQSRLAGIGSIVFAIGCAWFLLRLGPTPDYAGELLPGMIMTGIGVGLTLPSLSSAAAGSLPPESFATGSAVLTMSRQIGSVLGVALLIAVLGGSGAEGGLATRLRCRVRPHDRHGVARLGLRLRDRPGRSPPRPKRLPSPHPGEVAAARA